MEILISMKADDMRRTKFRNLQMGMPAVHINGHFISEIREAELDKIDLLKKYGEILLKKLNSKRNFAIEYTEHGFKLKKQVDYDKDYMEEWDGWVEFSRELYEQLEEFFVEEEN
jgi:hypothetical protein